MSLDVLGIHEDYLSYDEYIYDKKQITWRLEGCYETGLVWKRDYSSLSNDMFGSMDRLRSLLKPLKQSPEKIEAHNNISK